ncbi:[protein-PII] uridylyltransferase [Cardiobacterium hominis]|uniref:[protein-PII] uridylyltransferase n=1 Tax=Cardiobacterium hominis TaxID=2718 RepID=UPI0028E571DF|nr:[protein-PII] uridylyltransferase [Cardiobacterium hominis]
MLALPPDWQPAAPALSPLAEAARARDYLRELRHGLAAHIGGRDYDVHRLIAHYTAQIDRILGYLYQRTIANPRIRLYAIGGYGRGELFPASDIDLLLLTPDDLTDRDAIETFIQTLWQLGLDIAQHVHADRDLAPAATADIDLLTSLLENRQLAGEPHPIDPARPPLIAKTAYIRHKQQEQRARDAKQERLGQLEPNLKNSSGGLRDEHMITWLSAYCYHDRSHASLIAKNLMTPGESAGLHESRDALWRIRFALHLGGARQKNTLDFEQQKRLAATFGYRDQRHNLAIEQLMQHYYQHSMRIRRINQRVVSHIEADHQPPQPAVPLTRDYASQHGKLTLRDPASFTQNPNQPWELFQYLQQNPTIREPHPDLVRHIRRHRDSLTNIARRRDADNRRAFLALLAQPGNVHPQLARIHQYGLLYRYIPAFAHITGRMQYDLFHQYTVDQHTLKLIETLDRLVRPDPAYPEAAETLTRLKNPAILYLAALFHDIGKGYDGDHSQTGAQIADLYARENDAIPPEDRALLTWLVAHHLDHSLTAQKKDLTDPDTIAAYAAIIPSAEHLDHLYLLTLADISATNPSLWNPWRASLLYDLYQQTRHQLEHHQDSLHAREHRAREQAKAQLASDAQTLEHLWAQLPEAYFRGETAAAIAAKTRHLLAHGENHAVSLIQEHPPRLFITSPNPADILLVRITHYLEQHNHNIHEARLYTTADHRLTLQEYTLSENPPPAPELAHELEQHIADKQPPPPLARRLPRERLKHFTTHTRVHIQPEGDHTTLELTCKDRHGLLSLISRILLAHGVHISHAKIGTYSEKVEDSFHLTDAQHRPLTDAATLAALKQALLEALQ